MTTISPNRRRAPRSRKKFFIIFVMCALLLGVVALVRSPLQGAAWFILTPLTEARNAAAAATSIFFDGFASHQALSADNAALRAALAEATTALADKDLLYAENIELKARLGRSSLASSTPTVLASVVSRPPGVPYDTLMLDVGTRDGVAEGDMVTASGSVYIGIITEVYTSSSRATLLSSPGEVHSATLLARAASSTLASHPLSVLGQGGGSFKAEVPAGALVSVGDEVVFQGSERGLVARVVYVEKKEDTSFQTLYMHLPINIQSVRMVEVRPATLYEHE